VWCEVGAPSYRTDLFFLRTLFLKRVDGLETQSTDGTNYLYPCTVHFVVYLSNTPRYTAQQTHRQPVSTEQRSTHTQHTTCCHSTKLI